MNRTAATARTGTWRFHEDGFADTESRMANDITPDPGSSLEPPADPGLLTTLPLAMRWLALALVSGVMAVVLNVLHVPAALLLGPMVAGIIVAINGARLTISRIPFVISHALIGCMVARSLDAAILATFVRDWPIFVATVLAIIAASTFLGYLLAREGTIPGTTAVWGTSAGAASAMLLLSEAYGADSRIVAFMQYLRVVCVASAASLIAAFAFHAAGGDPHPTIWFPSVDWIELAKTLVVAGIAAAIGAALKIPAGTMLLPMLATAILHGMGLLNVELPTWLLVIGYTILGWKIGLGFTRRILRHAARAFPLIMLSIMTLIAFSGGLALILWAWLDIDPLTAYLATSPGGLDSIVIIAASTPVDISFVLALQTARFLIILMLGGPISKFVARRIAIENSRG